MNIPYNKVYWTLYDIRYFGYRVEVKETSFFHSFNTIEQYSHISKARAFGIPKRDGTDYCSFDRWVTPSLERQSDVYVFCLNTGETEEEANPLDTNNWEFYVVLTKDINRLFGEQKTVSLTRIQEIADKTEYLNLKKEVDRLLALIPKDRKCFE